MRNYLTKLTRPLFLLITAGSRSLNERLPGLRLSHSSISPHVCFRGRNIFQALATLRNVTVCCRLTCCEKVKTTFVVGIHTFTVCHWNVFDCLERRQTRRGAILTGFQRVLICIKSALSIIRRINHMGRGQPSFSLYFDYMRLGGSLMENFNFRLPATPDKSLFISIPTHVVSFSPLLFIDNV